MRKFKNGDKVTAGEKYSGRWQDLTVLEYTPHGVRVYRGTNGHDTGNIPEEFLRLVDAPPTDKELAEKYRSLRKESSEVAEELKKRGYAPYANHDPMRLHPKDMKYTFRKSVTTTETI